MVEKRGVRIEALERSSFEFGLDACLIMLFTTNLTIKDPFDLSLLQVALVLFDSLPSCLSNDLLSIVEAKDEVSTRGKHAKHVACS